MLNAEKYKDRILEVASNNKVFGLDTKTNKIDNCSSMNCRDCLFYTFGTISEHDVNRIKWLISEYKEPIKVSKLEYDILTYILKNTECRYITRNKSRSLCVHSYKPVKDTQYGQWTAVCDKVKSCEVFNNLFPFIKWEDKEPTLIKEVLNNCEVVEDESNE